MMRPSLRPGIPTGESGETAGRTTVGHPVRRVIVDRVIFGHPLRSVAFDVAVSGLVALLVVAWVVDEPGGWEATLVGVVMALVRLFRRTHPSAVAAVVAALARSVGGVRWHSPHRNTMGRPSHPQPPASPSPSKRCERGTASVWHPGLRQGRP